MGKFLDWDRFSIIFGLGSESIFQKFGIWIWIDFSKVWDRDRIRFFKSLGL